MPTLLQINSTLNKGSTGRIAEQIGQFARTQGNWDVWMAHGPRYKNSSELNSIQIESLWGERLHGLWSRLFDRHGLGSVFSTIRLVKRLERGIRPDVIHLHNLHGYYINYEILFEYLASVNTPVVWTLHDCWAFTGHCTHFDFIGCERWKTECYECPQKKSYPQSYLLDRSRKNYYLKKKLFTSLDGRLTVVPVSRWLEGLVRESFLQAQNIHQIYNGVDVCAFSPNSEAGESVRKKYGFEGKTVLLGVATGWGERKGFGDFLKLAELLKDRYQIVLLGLSETQIKGLPENITGLQRTESIEELAAIYNAADIVLNLSSQESFGLTTVEGFACGIPGIVYNRTASPELISDETGFIVEKGEMQQLVEAIQAIESRGKASYVKACRERAVQCFDKQKRFQEYVDLYTSLIQ
jgi:putative colanic acid biosynthesis glycosyltransferase